MPFTNIDNTRNPNKFTFEVPEDFEYKNLRNLVATYGIDYRHKVNALFINTKGAFGDQPVIATGRELVNAPQHLTEQVKEILKDDENLSRINNGVVGFEVYEYENQYGTQYGLYWIYIGQPKKVNQSKPASSSNFDDDIPF